MVDDDATQEAGPVPTTALDPLPTSITPALAYSDETGSMPVAEYYEPTRRWWPVAAAVAVIITVTGGATAAILWLGHRPAAHSAEPAPQATPGPLNGIYRFDGHNTERVTRNPDGTITGAYPPGSEVETEWLAIRSACVRDICTASTVPVSSEHPDHAEDYEPIVLTLDNGRWRNTEPNVSHQPCGDGIPGADTWESLFELTQWPDGTLTGKQVDTVITNECRAAGQVTTVPLTATRMGDVPPTVVWGE